MVAAFDVPSQGLSRNVKNESSFTEALFLYLVRARNIALIGPRMVRALGSYWLLISYNIKVIKVNQSISLHVSLTVKVAQHHNAPSSFW
jgi:hypothetical protein